MFKSKKRYQVWSSAHGRDKLYNSFDTYEEAEQLMLKLYRQYPRSWRFYIREYDYKEIENGYV